MMLISIPSHEILVGFVLKRRVVLDEERIANHIEELVAGNATAGAAADAVGNNNNNNATSSNATTRNS